MIVFPEHKIVIITPPHTASRNLHSTFCRPPWNAFWVIGPAPDHVSIDHHFAQIAEEWRDYLVAVVVRRPLQRLVGLWQHHRWWQVQRGMPFCSWPEFVEAVAEDDRSRLSWLYRYSIVRLLNGQPWQHVLRFHCLDEDLSQLLGEPVLIDGNRTEYDPDEISPSRDDVDRITAVWSADFRVFGRWFA